MTWMQAPYQAYLIRLWPARNEGAGGCRVSLVDVATREQSEFACLEGLFGYLRAHAEDEGKQVGLENRTEGMPSDVAR